MKNIKVLTACLILIGIALPLQADSSNAEGYWKTFDDKTKALKSIVKLWEDNGEMKGMIVKLFPKKGEDPDPKCDKCKGERKDKRILGMEFMWGLKKNGGKWKDGRILDPENGKIYRSQLEVVDNGKKLEVYGYIKILFKIGRTQTWLRTDFDNSEKK